MTSNPQTKHANKTIENAKKIQNISSKIFFQKYNSNNSSKNLQNLVELAKTMNHIVKTTDKAMKGAKFAESRARARLAAVKKASSDTIKYTARAKRAAIASKKAAQSAVITSKKIQQNSNHSKSLETTYKIQIKAALIAAKESEKNTDLALKSSKLARAAARIPLEAKKI